MGFSRASPPPRVGGGPWRGKRLEAMAAAKHPNIAQGRAVAPPVPDETVRADVGSALARLPFPSMSMALSMDPRPAGLPRSLVCSTLA